MSAGRWGDVNQAGLLRNFAEWKREQGRGWTAEVGPCFQVAYPWGRNLIHSMGSCIPTNNGDWGVTFHQMTPDWGAKCWESKSYVTCSKVVCSGCPGDQEVAVRVVWLMDLSPVEDGLSLSTGPPPPHLDIYIEPFEMHIDAEQILFREARRPFSLSFVCYTASCSDLTHSSR